MFLHYKLKYTVYRRLFAFSLFEASCCCDSCSPKTAAWIEMMFYNDIDGVV